MQECKIFDRIISFLNEFLFTDVADENLRACARSVYGPRPGLLPPKTRKRKNFDIALHDLSVYRLLDVADEDLQGCVRAIYGL